MTSGSPGGQVGHYVYYFALEQHNIHPKIINKVYKFGLGLKMMLLLTYITEFVDKINYIPPFIGFF